MENIYQMKIRKLIRYDWPLHFILLFTNWLPDNVMVLRFRGFISSFFFGKCGKDLRLGRGITFYNPSNIYLGDNIYIALGCWFSASDLIEINNEVMVGPYCIFSSSNHTRVNSSYRYGKPNKAPIYIGNGSWLGGHCAILKGVSVGKGVVVGANTVINKSIPDNSFFAGNPGKVIKPSKSE